MFLVNVHYFHYYTVIKRRNILTIRSTYSCIFVLQESSQSKARSEVTVPLQWEIKKMIRYDWSKLGFIKHPRISPPFFVLAYIDIFFKKRCIPLHKYVFVIITCAMHLWLNQKGFCFLSSLAMNKKKASRLLFDYSM